MKKIKCSRDLAVFELGAVGLGCLEASQVVLLYSS